MSLIDQRILIVAPVETVWSYVADPRMVSKWHQGCKQVSVLTTRATGVGTRRRCVDESGRATVEETTAWFENIGYEYFVVDGPYRDFRGRFRLQAVPEGTIVNWTVEYHLRGLLAGPRNLLSFRRHFEDLMAESLRNLRKLLENSGVRLDPEKHARFAMQSAPSAELRASRSSSAEGTTRPGTKEAQPPAQGAPSAPGALRPVSVGDDDVPDIPADRSVAPLPARVPDKAPDKGIDIPGLAAPTLVRPQPAPPETDALSVLPAQPVLSAQPVQPVQSALPAVPPSEPSTVRRAEPAADLEDTKPRPPKGLREALTGDRQDKPDKYENYEKPSIIPAVDDLDEPSDVSGARSAPTVPISMVAPPYEPPPVQETQTMEFAASGPPSTLPEVPSTPPKRIPRLFEPDLTADDTPARASVAPLDMPGPSDPIVPPPTSKEDTGEISIWDAFGLERPSEKAQADLEAIIASLQPRPETPGQNGHLTSRHWKRSKAAPHVRGVTSRRAPRLKTGVRVRPAHK